MTLKKKNCTFFDGRGGGERGVQKTFSRIEPNKNIFISNLLLSSTFNFFPFEDYF